MTLRRISTALMTLLMTLALALPVTAHAQDATDMHRIYNPNSGEHFYTSNTGERDALVRVGWIYEGVGWQAPAISDSPVYRLYSGTDHHYTTSVGERNYLVSVGWTDEGIGWYSDDNEGVPLYRQFNPYVDPGAAKNNSGSHNYTKSKAENDALVRIGWRAEGIAWYGVSEGDDDEVDYITTDDLAQMQKSGKVEVIYREGGLIRAIMGPFTDAKVHDCDDAANVINAASELYAGGYWAEPTDITQTKTPGDQEAHVPDEYFYRFEPDYDGIKALGSQIVLTTDADGTVTGMFSTYEWAIDDVDFDITIEQKDVESIVLDDLSSRVGAPVGAGQLAISSEVIVDCLEEPALLEWRVRVCNAVWQGDSYVLHPVGRHGGFIDMTYYVAANGQIDDAGTIRRVVSNDMDVRRHTVTQAMDQLDRTREIAVLSEDDESYLMEDTGRNIKTHTVAYADNAPNDPIYPGDPVTFRDQIDTTAVSVHANMEIVYDFYRYTLGRDSYDDAGAQIRVSYGQKDLNNAFWSSDIQQYVFGDLGGLTKALDVMGHEFTHAVIAYVVGNGHDTTLTYEGESGALNESLADIMACLIEYGSIEGKSSDGLWLIGEDSDHVIRSLSNPKDYSQPDHYKDRYTGPIDGDHDNGGVHTNSNIFNHAAYLMITNANSRKSVSDWARVFYRALHRMETDADFKDARAAVIASAKQLGFTKEELRAISNAFDAVGITGNGMVYATVTWDSAPGSHSDIDLDAYFYKVGSDQSVTVFHDWDDEGGLGGKEQATVFVDEPGTYIFAVNDSSDDYKRWNATCDIYDSTGNKLCDTCSTTEKVRIGDPISGRWWVVYRVTFDDGLTPTATKVNNYTNEYPEDLY